MRGKRTAMRLAVLVAIGLLATAASAGATITPTRDPGAVAGAMAAGGVVVTGASFVSIPPPASSPPPESNPAGVGDTPIAPFPADGSNYAVLSTGNVAEADQPDQPGAVFPSTVDGGTAQPNRGDAEDVTVLAIAIQVPAGANCLSFDFRFLSEEFPDFVGRTFNDAFVAELDTTSWTTASGVISGLENDFALDPMGGPVTINSTGQSQMSATNAVGTPFGGASAPLRAKTAVTPGAHTIYLSIFDQSDAAYDTAVFADALRTSNESAATCVRGSQAVGPALAITGPGPGFTSRTRFPTLTGSAGDGPGDAATVTVRVFDGADTSGALRATLLAPRSGTSWSVTPTTPIPAGTYTAQASQVGGNGGNGVSAPVTFTIVQPGDRDHDGVLDDEDTLDGSLPPVPGKSVDVRVVSGTVLIKYPAGKGPRAATPAAGFVPLKGAANIPIGSQLDTAKGRVALTSAADTAGKKTQTSDFYQGIFQVKQSVPKKKPKKPTALTTDLVMKGQIARSQCAPLKGARAAAANKKKGPKSVLGQLWGNGKGKFRTSGKYSSATVRGTIWLVQDRCDGTLTTVTRGTVQVADFRRHTTVAVKAGHSYLARAQRAASKTTRRKK
jgi:hypothetical protein